MMEALGKCAKSLAYQIHDRMAQELRMYAHDDFEDSSLG